MAISYSNSASKQRKHFPIELRPRLLKDFLTDDSNSCSSNGFRSFPRQLRDTLIQFDRRNSNSSNTGKLFRSKSAFQAVFNAIKHISFPAVKTPAILPRSLSRKLSKRRSHKKENDQSKITVRIKDIIRWKSFCDLVDENKYPPTDFLSSPTAAVTRSTSVTTFSSSAASSWCDSDFTAEECSEKYLPCVGKDSMEPTAGRAKYTAVGPKGELPCEEEEQSSPVSVLDYQFGEEDGEGSFSSFNRSLANLERTKQNLMEKMRLFESLPKLDPLNLEKWISMEDNTSSEEEDDKEEEEEESNGVKEKAMQLLNYVKETSSEGSFNANVDQLLLDFFKCELSTQNYETDWEMVSTAKAWMSGENAGVSLLDWGVELKKKAYIKDMDAGGKWSKFGEEAEEVGLEIEGGMLEILVDEVMKDLQSTCFW